MRPNFAERTLTLGRLKPLQARLVDLQHRFNFGFHLDVAWEPKDDGEVEAEVVNQTIRIYSRDHQKALELLDHEYLEALIHEHTKELQNVINSQRRFISKLLTSQEKRAYKSRERVVESLRKGLEG